MSGGTLTMCAESILLNICYIHVLYYLSCYALTQEKHRRRTEDLEIAFAKEKEQGESNHAMEIDRMIGQHRRALQQLRVCMCYEVWSDCMLWVFLGPT